MTNPELEANIRYVPAEFLSSEVIRDFYNIRRNQTPDYAAWLNLEIGTAKAYEENCNGPTPQEHFNRAYDIFDQVLDRGDDGERFKPFVLAQLAHAAHTAFWAKIEKEPLDIEIMAKVHREQLAVANSLAGQFERRPDLQDVQGMFTTIIGMTVLSSLQDGYWFPQLSSSRERLPHASAHLAPLPEWNIQVSQPLAFVLQNSQRLRAKGAVRVDFGTIVAQSWAGGEPQDGRCYDFEARREGLLATLDALVVAEKDGQPDPHIEWIATQVWTVIHAGELEARKESALQS